MRTFRMMAAGLSVLTCLAACNKNSMNPDTGTSDTEHDFTVELTCNAGIRTESDVKDFASFDVCVTSGEETDYTFTYNIDDGDYVIVERMWIGETRTITVTDTEFGKHTFEAVISRKDNTGPVKKISGETWMRGYPLISLKGSVKSAAGDMKFDGGSDISLYVTDMAEVALDYQPRTTVVQPILSLRQGNMRIVGEPSCKDGRLTFMMDVLKEGRDTLQAILINGELADTLTQAFNCTYDGEMDYGLDFGMSVRDVILGQRPVVDLDLKTYRKEDSFAAAWSMDGGVPRTVDGDLSIDAQGHAVITIPQEVMDRESHTLAITLHSTMSGREMTRTQEFSAKIIPLTGCRFIVDGKEASALDLEPGEHVGVTVVPVPEDATVLSSEMAVVGGRAQMTGDGWTRTLSRKLPGHDIFRVSIHSDKEYVFELPLTIREYITVGIFDKRTGSMSDDQMQMMEDLLQFTLTGLTRGFDFGSVWDVKVTYHGEVNYWEASGSEKNPFNEARSDKTDTESFTVSMAMGSAARMSPLNITEQFAGIRAKTKKSSRWKNENVGGNPDGGVSDFNMIIYEEFHYEPVIEKIEIHITPDKEEYKDILIFSSGDELITVK